jgi:hypothetical protein
MESPVATNATHLLQMDGRLGIGHTHMNGDTMIVQVWVLQDYKTDAWSSKYRIGLPLKVMTGYCTCSKSYGLVLCENGDMLVMVGFPVCWSSYSLHRWSLFYYDCNGQLLEEFQRQNLDPTVLGLYFKESLVKHVFFQRKNGGRARVPRFFRGAVGNLGAS